MFETGWEAGYQTGKFGSPYLGKASASPRAELPIWTFLLVCAVFLCVQRNNGMASTVPLPVSGIFNVCTEDVDAYSCASAVTQCRGCLTGAA